MLTIVMAKPMLFTMVRAVPRTSGVVRWATRVEKRGESAITTSPQKNKKAISNVSDSLNRNRGEVTQHKQDNNKNRVANFFAPNRNDRTPLATQASPPDAMMMNDSNGTLRCVSG